MDPTVVVGVMLVVILLVLRWKPAEDGRSNKLFGPSASSQEDEQAGSGPVIELINNVIITQTWALGNAGETEKRASQTASNKKQFHIYDV
jgi:hypothetical protein